MLMHITKPHDLHAVLDAVSATVTAVLGEEITDPQTEGAAVDELDTVTEEEIRAAKAAYQREYKRNNRDKINALQRKHYKKHREKVREYQRKWRLANPDKCREYNRNAWKRRALKLRQQSPPITTDDQLRQIVNDKRQQLKNSDNAEDWQ